MQELEKKIKEIERAHDRTKHTIYENLDDLEAEVRELKERADALEDTRRRNFLISLILSAVTFCLCWLRRHR